jgi:isoaspartyl peptidase/L-asparaginase-like protein (Ntn-hydrolase superfamily)
MEAIMQWLTKCCTRGVLGLAAAALLLSGVPAHAKAVSGAPDAASREGQPRLLAQSTTRQEEAEQLEKRRQEEQRKKMEQQQQQEKQQQAEPKKMKTRGALPEAAPEAMPPKPGGKRFGAGVVRKESGEEE